MSKTQSHPDPVSAPYLRRLIRASLKRQGYLVQREQIALALSNKEAVRRTHELAVQAHIARAEKALSAHESSLLSHIANGSEVIPEKICPRLIPVAANTENSLLFRYASLHWSIPISNGYGRRLRFLVVDEANNKLIGIIGLSDPVFSLAARDNWVGWRFEQRKQRLYHVLDAYVLGAVPPYAPLLAGKLVAMLATSREIASAFQERYSNRMTVLQKRTRLAELAMLTTTSALGRSSIYNRLKVQDRLLMQSVGYTTGWGTFHFSNGVYGKMFAYSMEHCEGTAKAVGWGGGKFRNRQEVIRKCLKELGFSENWMLHQVKREIFVAPLAKNTREFLRGESDRLDYWNLGADDLFAYFRERWLLPRALRNHEFQKFNREEWRLWK
jgi:hypothetical protein